MEDKDFARCLMNLSRDGGITVGREYPVIAVDDTRLTVLIEDDADEQVWLPAEFFDVDLLKSRMRGGYQVAVLDGRVRDPARDEVPVLMRLDSGAHYRATFVAFGHVADFANGYFWRPGIILVDRVTEERIKDVVRQLMRSGEYAKVFVELVKPWPEEEEERDD